MRGKTVVEQASFGIATALNAAAPVTVKFVPQADLPPGEPYERYIHQTRCVPTRDNLHDFFNGLCWLHFPQTKTRLNQLQAAEIAAAGVQPLRGPVRDALTVFDENAAFLIAPTALWEALRARDWQRLFVTLRPLWSEAQLVLFGHALLEKLVYPRKAIVAHVYCAPAAIYSVANLDAEVAAQLNAAGLAGKPFAPLPVLGVPGWWAENSEPSFYADAEVFRPPRQIA
nr:DUF3025 domain-containing protein [uncultured Albidiferax sp.]